MNGVRVSAAHAASCPCPFETEGSCQRVSRLFPLTIWPLFALTSLMLLHSLSMGSMTPDSPVRRGRDLKKQHEQRVYEREMQRITLPLSAFSNPTCELVDENTIVITAESDATPVQEGPEGGDPLMGQQAVTPGA